MQIPGRLKRFMVFSVLCLIATQICAQSTINQSNPWNLGFEQINTPRQSIYPWVRASSQDLHYAISLDSVSAKEGKYALRIAYAASGSALSQGQATNTIGLDIPCDTLTVSFYARVTGRIKKAEVSFNVFQNYMEKAGAGNRFKLNETAEWTHYTGKILMNELRFPTDRFRITASYDGDGSLWLDEITLLADGKPLETTTSYCKPVNEVVQPLSQQQITRLALLGQAWGFLKYYHPNVANGERNWDGELFRMIPVAKNAASDEAFSQSILQWIESLGSIPLCIPCDTSVPNNLLRYNVDLAWMSDAHFSQPLREKWLHLLHSRFKKPGFYGSYDKAGNALFNENSYNWRSGDYPNENFRLLTLFRYWNMIQYFSPYKNIIGRNWNEVLYEYVPRLAEAKDSLSYNLAVVELVHSVNDSHASTYNPVVAKEFELILPVSFNFIGNDLVASMFYSDSLATADDWKKGDIVEKIDGQTLAELIAQRKALAGGSNETAVLRLLNTRNLLTGGTSPTVTLGIRRQGKSFSKVMHRYTYSALRYQYTSDKTLFKILPGNIGYVNMGLLEVKHVDSMMLLMKDTRGIIFDIRNYPRGTGYAIAQYLLTEQKPFALCSFPAFEFPGAFKYTSPIKCGPSGPGKNKGGFTYAGKTVILVNELAQSHAEWTTMTLQAVPGAVTLGSQTSGADGNVSAVALPGGISTRMTGLGVFYPDQSPTQRVGVRIDKIVKPTLQGLLDGKDEVLDAGVKEIDSN
ncbi:S41 family peptidase [Paraflavitalea sp. CAU 1676]|uniref:S41 family peptidase n=1 Tax=Paraflavitalea sp. CAU 1676 TaxID=3032598 RepID=UPI0023DB09A7|nr:S41 family peptidase [Paraflavitalea sp. CAU 1676]MDF2189458.1 S41 family peptidase [Paraflavitalea sp. CAU 1676]